MRFLGCRFYPHFSRHWQIISVRSSTISHWLISIPKTIKWVWVNTYRYIFSGMNIHKSQLFWGSLGTRVLTHPQIINSSPASSLGSLVLLHHTAVERYWDLPPRFSTPDWTGLDRILASAHNLFGSTGVKRELCSISIYRLHNLQPFQIFAKFFGPGYLHYLQPQPALKEVVPGKISSTPSVRRASSKDW